jgi:hypothetical protein
MENWFLSQALNWGVNRLKEPSTWASAAAALAASLHIQFNADATHSFITLGVALASFLGIVLSEGVKK